ncbi:site-specific integrase [Sporosarcina sp. P3]|uniref:site-specific integrase n=1 Tax=Sporosarcina sp. P3 TaxID=2048245 RepID=UPI000C1631D6|nr:site-specific integrase [Sporosarcina sp. P3]PID20156.1 site-specific integrase [Sporosarcina sp. P3]
MANIEKRGDNSYRFTVTAGKDANGKYIRKRMTYTVTEKFTPKKLEEHLRHEYLKFKEDVLSETYIKPEKMTFATFVEEWKKNFADKELSETTYINRMTVLKSHILPVISHVRMDQFKPLLLADLLNGLTRKDGKEGDLSVASKVEVYKTLSSVFKYAVKWKVIMVNPMDSVNKPSDRQAPQSDELNVYEPNEIKALFAAAENEPIYWQVFLTLALTAGLRRGELLGLEWGKVDKVNKCIDVSTTIVKGKTGALIKQPKTRKSNRLITLPDSTMDELDRFRKHWVKEKLRMGSGWIENEKEWLFCNENGTHFYPDTPSTWWKRFTERAELRYIRLHDLRHTFATLQIARGVHAKVIAERLGHSKISTTMDVYGHLLRSADQDAASTLEGIGPVRNKQVE